MTWYWQMTQNSKNGFQVTPQMQLVPDVGVAPSPPDRTTEEIARLYHTERHRLLRLAALFVSDHASAEDLVHEAFAALQRHWPSLQDRSAAAGYLSVSVANGARSLLRRRRVALRRLRAAEPDEMDAADAPVLLAEEHRAVVAAVRALPKRQQQVIALRYWSRMSEAEIAAALGISAGTVKSSAARGLVNIHKQLEADE